MLPEEARSSVRDDYMALDLSEQSSGLDVRQERRKHAPRW
jgi:hypothetical protein